MIITPGENGRESSVSLVLLHLPPASLKNQKLLLRLLPASENLVLPDASASASLVDSQTVFIFEFSSGLTLRVMCEKTNGLLFLFTSLRKTAAKMTRS